ncbi:hypothetical protein Ccrd_006304 [Cynara cardunculus var. scolymus]|uniref:Uncharacterized protein n=1 Tax=Cynara cardunculus var. scolymus TaxID=59895 RepID=A0A103XJ45_CYNCS|nr:hypothetical protein Ccrd_006304 [Cynara cardunculus var. scolymus]
MSCPNAYLKTLHPCETCANISCVAHVSRGCNFYRYALMLFVDENIFIILCGWKPMISLSHHYVSKK